MKEILVLGKGSGRSYGMGGMQAVFKADEEETDESYSVSEWWLDPGCDGPGAHCHEANDEIFYVLHGVLDFLLGEEWISASEGTFIRIPAGVMHDFCNTGTARAGVLNVFIPGGFERHMPAIVEWFAHQDDKAK